MLLGKHLFPLLATLLLSSVEISTGQEEPQVTAPAGTFRGKVLTSPSGVEYASYRGIPYALPPTGERRFAKPEPYPFIQETYDASKFGPICVQNMNGTAVGQEDCLYLNVFTPLHVERTGADNSLRSVLVFIHGGGLTLGLSNIYLPGSLIAQTDIVVVTTNYRLGWMGYLHGNSSALPGNQGFWDQLLALRWVKANIRAFGGDPDDVTVSGESAGSFSVSLLSVSPLAKGLFQKAILQSGSTSMLPTPPRTSNTILEQISRQLGCSVEPVTGNEEDVVTCLKQQPADIFYFNFTLPVFYQLITSGNEILPKPMSQLLTDSQYLSDVGFYDRDYFVTLTKDDGYLFVNSIYGMIDTSSFESSVRGYAEIFQVSECFARQLITEYSKLYNGLEQALVSIITDNFFVLPILKFLHSFQNNPAKDLSSRKSYLLSHDHSPTYLPHMYYIHAFDLPYLFDMHPNVIAESFFLFRVKEDFTDEDVKLKSDFIDLVGSFTKYGTPGSIHDGETIVKLPPFDEDTKSYLSFQVHPSVKEDIISSREYIWNTLVPQWMQQCQQ